ncbi:hypothetical protein Y032_0186g1096 [Ancylostoma ceylanicum]|uniref:Uncharacterized protein n=1 Tax=Ancylostoma ceylanicum TaxID=53326 RepID=A0A016SS01_9BILA|nr:hypothetical protein Y032_0186g1096 [Ancylostoma ceylanicum]
MVFRRGMSVTPPLSEQLPRTNKFKGEAFGIPTNTRTIYAGSEDDTIKRESRVILLVGPQTAGKSSLIDFLCNYFYGAELEKTTRYHIANEKFDSTTPEKQIITYVFNDTKMDVRPVVIDTPSTSGAHAEENREIMARWLKENEKLKIDAIGVVFSAYQRMTASEEEYLQKALAVFPEHLQSKRIVFITGSDGSSPPVGMLRRQPDDVKFDLFFTIHYDQRFNLDRAGEGCMKRTSGNGQVSGMLLDLARAPAPAMQMPHALSGFEPGRPQNAPARIVLAHAAPLAQINAE